MTQRRKIAIAYALAVPVVLAIVLLQHAALFGVSGFESGMAHSSEIIREAESVSALLVDVDRQAKELPNAVNAETFQSTVVQLRSALQQLNEHVATEPTITAKCQALDSLVEKQLATYQKAKEPTPKPPQRPNRAHAQPSDAPPNYLPDITKLLGSVESAEQEHLGQQGAAAHHNMHMATAFTTYGGGLMIWLVGVGAFLLFHDEKARAWAGVERRVHTRVLEDFPLGVSVTTDAGVILYANAAEEELFGYKPGELLGGNANLLHALDEDQGKQTVNEILDRLGNKKVWAGQLPIRKKDGTVLKAESWILNMEIPGRWFRVFVHNTD